MATICRLCLGNSPDMLPLFETLIGEKLLIEVILSTLGVELDNSSDLPRQVCQDCYKNVEFLNEFCMKLIDNQCLLNKRKGKENEIDIPQESSRKTVEQSTEEEESNERILLVKTEPDGIDGNNSDTSTKNDESMSEISQERIEHEPISIKQEDDGMDDDETTHEGKVKPRRRKTKKKMQKMEPNLHKCHVCGPVFENENDLKDHLGSHENKLPYECSQCTTPTNPIILPTLYLLNKHFETHGFRLTCKICPIRFKSIQSRYYHMQTVHKSQSYKNRCETCGKEFKNNIAFANHVRNHLSVIAQRYKCEVCQRVFKTQNALLRHEFTHTKRRGRYVCKWCDETFFCATVCLKHAGRCKLRKVN